MAEQKPPEGQTPSNTGAESGGGPFNNLGPMESENTLESLRSVIKPAVEQSNQDLKNNLGHLKGDPGEGGLDGMNLQDAINRTSEAQQLTSNILNKMSSTAGSIISKTEGGGGGSKPKGKAGLGLIVGLLLLGIAVFVGVRFFVPWNNAPGTTMPEPGPPEANIASPVASDQSGQYPPNPCDLKFENPSGPEGIPLQGALDVMWTRVPGAASYELRVIPPDGAGEPWIIPTDDTSKKIYMENFPWGGQYKFAVMALDGNGAALCSIEMAFDKPATGEEARQARDSEGDACVSGLWGC